MENKNTYTSERMWKSASLYLNNVSGHKIVEIQQEINNSTDKFVTATQIFPSVDKDTGKQPFAMRRSEGEDGAFRYYPAYDAFIYYKEKVNLEQNNKSEDNIIIEEKTKYDIVIPQ